MIGRFDEQPKPLAAGLFGGAHERLPEPGKAPASACPLETARAFAQLFAASQGGEQGSVGTPPSPCHS